jgi:small conductance mechanosensitive channel
MPFHLPNDLSGNLKALLPLLVDHALSVLGAIAILLIGIWLAGRADAVVTRIAGRTPHFDVMLRGFFGSVARYAVLTVTVLAVLSQFGIQTTSIVAVLGAAGLAVGLALQGTLSHLAAGVLLLIFRPFRIGDKVAIGGIQGTVRALTLFWTEMASDDNVQIIVPNGGVWGQPLKNFTAYPAIPHGVEVRFRVPETIDLDTALPAVRTALSRQPKIQSDPAPSVTLDRSSTEHALEIVATFSAAEADVAVAKSDLIAAVHAALAQPPTA